ncbi:SEC-C metal-binding domain-containing protein [Oceanobacillus neutriphilus]|uniref:Tetratricopeptide repeat protein n=1 Tax=Oceanobacillus neutriphilus TaxID=531815 RepID=A0ABQ2NVR5_9BACI|nr:SEC-C metal-binding domain-containing protein [Oceanobacillus neutriphilus]GGP11689.1 hypothetical protein GCM10011346_24690 [Oceanobacillus neutriphilus]
MKIGRNDPCLCGSGKKYKKCCMDKIENNQSNTVTLPDRFWQLEDVEELDTNIILSNLNRYGVLITEEIFIKELKTVMSAEELVQQWIERYRLNTSDRMIDFTFLAVKVLAKRLAPEHLLLERIDDWIEEGYEHDKGYFDEEEAAIWLKAWDYLLRWAKRKGVSSVSELDQFARQSMNNVFSNWIPELDMALANASIHDKVYAKARNAFADEFLERFPDSDTSIIDIAIVAKGEALFRLGEIEQTERVFKSYIEKQPKNTWIYIHWADLYNPKLRSRAENREKAIGLYQQAIACADNKADLEIAEERLGELIELEH